MLVKMTVTRRIDSHDITFAFLAETILLSLPSLPGLAVSKNAFSANDAVPECSRPMFSMAVALSYCPCPASILWFLLQFHELSLRVLFNTY